MLSKEIDRECATCWGQETVDQMSKQATKYMTGKKVKSNETLEAKLFSNEFFVKGTAKTKF